LLGEENIHMVARKWVRLAQAVVAELGDAADMRSLSQAPDDVLLRASDRCGLLLAAQFPRVESRLAALRRRLDEVRDASEVSPDDEDEDAMIRRHLRAMVNRDCEGMSPTDRRTKAEALRTLAVMGRASRRRGDREKRESQIVQRPAEFNVEPRMVARSILPRPMPVEVTEHKTLAERARPAQTSEERLRQQAFAEQARQEQEGQRRLARAYADAAYYRVLAARPRDDDTPRRIGMPGLGGM
jgi:hypothetical protein